MAELPIGANFYSLPSRPLSAQECVNGYAYVPETTTTTKLAIFRTPGIEQACTAGTDPNRGGHNFVGDPYFVQGEDLYRVDQSLSPGGVVSYSSTKVNGATTIPGMAQVVMADNGEEGGQMVIVCPDVATKFNTYIYDGSTLASISDNDFDGPASSVQYVDGYFLFTKADGQKFFISDLRDGEAYNALDFASAEADPDYVVAPAIIRNNVVIFGSQTAEPFQNIGGSGFPYQRIPGGVQNYGLASKYAFETVNDLLIFLGGGVNETPMIWITDGGSRPEKLSTTAIDTEIASYSESTIENTFAFKYSQDGEQFICFTFPGEKTFCYGFRSKLWHTRESRGSSGGSSNCRISCVVAAFGVLLVGDLSTNKIGVLSREVYTEYDNQMTRRFVTPQIDNEGMPFFLNALELVCDTGEGLTSGQGSNPAIWMSASRDGGRTFNNPTTRYAGEIGQYGIRVIWNQLGRFPTQACFKFETTDPIDWVFRKVNADFS